MGFTDDRNLNFLTYHSNHFFPGVSLNEKMYVTIREALKKSISKVVHICTKLCKVANSSAEFCKVVHISDKFCQVLPSSAQFHKSIFLLSE